MHSEFLQRHDILSTELLNQGFFKNRLILSFKTFLGRYQILLTCIMPFIFR
jgi:hypothetical protein